MNGLRFEVGCFYCGGEVRWLTGSAPGHLSVAAVVKCCSCGREALVRVTCQPCPTPAALRRREQRQAVNA